MRDRDIFAADFGNRINEAVDRYAGRYDVLVAILVKVEEVDRLINRFDSCVYVRER